jgi:hypothetical protein
LIEVVRDHVSEVERADRDLPVLARHEPDANRMIDRCGKHGPAVLLVPVGRSVPPPTKLIRSGATASIGVRSGSTRTSLGATPSGGDRLRSREEGRQAT